MTAIPHTGADQAAKRGIRRLAQGQRPARQHAGGEPSLEHVDDEHREPDLHALRAQRIGRPRVAAAHGADVHAAEAADDQAADDRAQEIGEQRLDQECAHGPVNTSASMQRTLPPPSLSMVGTGTASTVSVAPEIRA